jgi:cell wall-associated NlpC family hydrolase
MTIAHYPQARAPAPVRWWARAAQATTLLLLVAGCASDPGRPSGPSGTPGGYAQADASSRRANDVLLRALGLVGTPYRYGGNTPAGGFDCSGLVGFVFMDAAGLRLPRSTGELMDLDAPRVSQGRLRPGDLVLFRPGGGGHVGIYVGEGRFVHAPSAGGTVRMDRLDADYWTRAYAGARRVLD